MTKISEREQIG